MTKIDPLDLRFTEEVRALFLRFVEGITGYQATICLTKGWSSDAPEIRWTFGAYGPENIENVAPELERLGHALLYAADGLTVAIPQFQYLFELQGKTFGLAGKDLVLMPRSAVR